MDISPLETAILAKLKSVLDRSVRITTGPFTPPALSGLRTEVYVHAASFTDFDGATLEGDRIARHNVNKPTRVIYVEERPARITIMVTCIAGSYHALKSCDGLIAPAVLYALEPIRSFSLGKLEGGIAEIRFADCIAWLHESKTEYDHADPVGYYLGRLVFFLDGFANVQVIRSKDTRKLTAGQPR
jgi:hypothetical protein